MFVVHTFKRTVQWLVPSFLLCLFLSPDEVGSMTENRDGENLWQTQRVTKFVGLCQARKTDSF